MQDDLMNFSSFLQQLASATHKPTEVKQRFNPRPPGVIREGSASEAVLMVLRSHKGFLTCGQLVFATKRNERTVAWSLIYLRSQGLIEAAPDARRSRRYLRYRAVPQAGGGDA